MPSGTIPFEAVPGLARKCLRHAPMAQLPSGAIPYQALPGVARRCKAVPRGAGRCQEVPSAFGTRRRRTARAKGAAAKHCQELPRGTIPFEELPYPTKHCHEVRSSAKSCHELPQGTRPFEQVPSGAKPALFQKSVRPYDTIFWRCRAVHAFAKRVRGNPYTSITRSARRYNPL